MELQMFAALILFKYDVTLRDPLPKPVSLETTFSFYGTLKTYINLNTNIEVSKVKYCSVL